MALRAAEVEVLITANDQDIARAEKNVKATGDRIEKRPVTQKIQAADGDVSAAIDRAIASGHRMSKSLVQDFLESNRAASKSADDVERVLTQSYGVSAEAAKELARVAKGGFGEVTAASKSVDTKAAVASIDRVATAAKKLVTERTIATVDANIDRATKSVDRVQARLDYLRSVETDLDVSADISRAEASLQKLTRQRDGLVSAREKLEVIADTGAAEQDLKKLGDTAAASGKEAGERGGHGLSESLDGATRGIGEKVGDVVGGDIADTLESALIAIPVAGGIILAAVAIGKAISGAIQDGMQVEKGYDRLEALAGLDPAQAMRIGRAAGEAYANAYGDSIESNMDVARLAVQFDLIDENATTRDAQQVIQSLAGIADVLDEDVRPTATAVTTLLKTGMAKSAQEAFDILAAGQREGVNRGEDLLDTLTEYPSVLRKLGIDGSQMLGLINQALNAGARNSDVAADALKEFQIRATDASKSSAEGFKLLGLNAEEMTAKIAAGGDGAREGLDQVLTGMRSMEDAAKRNAVATALFGTKAEDLGDTLFAMDLSTAVAQLDGVNGAAQRMFDTLSSNDATRIEQAGRNIQTAFEGVQGAIAAGLSKPLGELADWVSENRGPIMQFLLGLVGGALDFGEAMLRSTADITEGIGDLTSGPLAQLADTFATILAATGNLSGADGLRGAAEDMRNFGKTADQTAENLRTKAVAGIELARAKVHEFGDQAVALGYLNDASVRLATAISNVGVAADGSVTSLAGINTANLSASESGRKLESQIRGALSALDDQITTADAAGESQENLKQRYDEATEALIGQLRQMGMTREEAQGLIDTVLKTPTDKVTIYGSNAVEEQGKVQSLAYRIETLPDGSVVIRTNTDTAQAALDQFVDRNTGRTITVNTLLNERIAGYNSRGGLTYAGGGPVFGPGSETSDSINARLSNNEHVWTAAEVRGMGGHSRVAALRALAASGRIGEYLPGFATGGPVVVPESTWRVVPPEPQVGVNLVTTVGETPRPGAQLTLIDRSTYYGFDPTEIERTREQRLTRALDALGG